LIIELEAVWAEVMVGRVRMVIGSVYVPPGDMNAINALDTVIGKILQSHQKLLIGMDANARNSLWDYECVSVPLSRKSTSMGVRLEEILDKYGLQLHNTGVPTYCSGSVSTAPDVTISKGIGQYGQVSWSVIDDELRTPHEGLLMDIGDRAKIERREVINWKLFDWTAYCSETKIKINSLYDKWEKQQNLSVDFMVKELTASIQQCVETIATMKIITEHSKPWINAQLAEQLKKLHVCRKKCRHRKSPMNVAELTKLQQDTYQAVKKAADEWWQSQCQKLVEVNESEKWKIIRRLMNDVNTRYVQPIKKMVNGEQTYLFNDDDIRQELENYHIRKAVYNVVEMLKSNFLDNRLSKRKNRFLFDYRFSHCTIPPR